MVMTFLIKAEITQDMMNLKSFWIGLDSLVLEPHKKYFSNAISMPALQNQS